MRPCWGEFFLEITNLGEVVVFAFNGKTKFTAGLNHGLVWVKTNFAALGGWSGQPLKFGLSLKLELRDKKPPAHG